LATFSFVNYYETLSPNGFFLPVDVACTVVAEKLLSKFDVVGAFLL